MMMKILVILVVVYFVGYKNLIDLVHALRGCVQEASKSLVQEVKTELEGGKK